MPDTGLWMLGEIQTSLLLLFCYNPASRSLVGLMLSLAEYNARLLIFHFILMHFEFIRENGV